MKGIDLDKPQPLRSKPDYSPKVGTEGPSGGMPERRSAAAGSRVSLLPVVLTVPRRGLLSLPEGHRSSGSLLWSPVGSCRVVVSVACGPRGTPPQVSGLKTALTWYLTALQVRIWYGSCRAKIKVLQGRVPFWRPRESPWPRRSQLPEAARCMSLTVLLEHVLSSLWLPLCAFNDSYDYVRLAGAVQDALPISRSLT